MKDRFLIVVEGIADETFIRQYIYHLFGQKVPDNFILRTNGKDNLKSSVAINRMRSMTDQGGINLVIFDADNNFETRRASILEWKKQNGLEFELFLLPNNQDKGELEDLLENIINPNNRPIMDCWEHYEKELVILDIPVEHLHHSQSQPRKPRFMATWKLCSVHPKAIKKRLRSGNENTIMLCIGTWMRSIFCL